MPYTNSVIFVGMSLYMQRTGVMFLDLSSFVSLFLKKLLLSAVTRQNVTLFLQTAEQFKSITIVLCQIVTYIFKFPPDDAIRVVMRKLGLSKNNLEEVLLSWINYIFEMYMVINNTSWHNSGLVTLLQQIQRAYLSFSVS